MRRTDESDGRSEHDDRPFDGWCCRVRFILDTWLAMGNSENVPNLVSRSRSKSPPGCTPTKHIANGTTTSGRSKAHSAKRAQYMYTTDDVSSRVVLKLVALLLIARPGCFDINQTCLVIRQTSSSPLWRQFWSQLRTRWHSTLMR
jgi:hypothetical protein